MRLFINNRENLGQGVTNGFCGRPPGDRGRHIVHPTDFLAQISDDYSITNASEGEVERQPLYIEPTLRALQGRDKPDNCASNDKKYNCLGKLCEVGEQRGRRKDPKIDTKNAQCNSKKTSTPPSIPGTEWDGQKK